MASRGQSHVIFGALMLAVPLTACGGGSGGSPGDPSPGGGGASVGGGSAHVGGNSSSSGSINASSGTSGSSSAGASAGGAAGSAGAAGVAGSAGASGSAPTLGTVTFVPYYEAGSAWESSARAKAMVTRIFAEVGAALRTSGSWNATIEVYLTDDNPNFANTFFDASFEPVVLEGKTVLAPSTWREIVLGEPDPNGPADSAGKGFDFGVAVNVLENADNDGLLRHEMMHGLGAVNLLPSPLMSPANQLSRLVAGDWYEASVYDLALRDAAAPLLGSYDEKRGMFQVAPFKVDATFTEWTDGTAGFFFRGIGDNGGPLDMPLMTSPSGDSAKLVLNEPEDLMSAASHPTWDHIAEPDRAFFRAMHYRLAP